MLCKYSGRRCLSRRPESYWEQPSLAGGWCTTPSPGGAAPPGAPRAKRRRGGGGAALRAPPAAAGDAHRAPSAQERATPRGPALRGGAAPSHPPTRPLPASAGQKAARVVNPAASRKGLRGIPRIREAAASRLRMEPRPRTRSGQQRKGPNVVPSQQPVWGGGVRRGSPGTSPGQVTPTPSVSESPAPLQHLLSSCSKESRKTFQPRPPHPLSSPEGSKGNHEGLQPRPALNGGRGEAAKLFPPYPHPVSFCRGSFRSLRQVQPLSIPVCRSPPPDPPVARLIFPKRPHVAHTHTPYTNVYINASAHAATRQAAARRHSLRGRAGQAARTPPLATRPRLTAPRVGGSVHPSPSK